MPLLLAFFVLSGLYEAQEHPAPPEKIPVVEALEPLIVPAVVLVTINFWATCFVQKSSKYMLPCFVLFMAHLSLSRSSDLLALLSTPSRGKKRSLAKQLEQKMISRRCWKKC